LTVIKYPEQRVGVFVDVQNMYHSAKNIYKARANFKAILEAAVSDRKLIRAFAYVIKTETGEETAFFEALSKSGYEMKVKDLQIFAGGMKKADWDVGMAMDAVKLSSSLDAVVIVSGDGDFVPLIEYLQQNRGTQVEVMAFGKSASGKLREAADDFFDLGENPRQFLIRSTRIR
jgi:uncharacterized LabA/DUF88 family protein